MPYKNYLIDCDGVILDSNNFKIKAMQQTLEKYPANTINDFLEYFKENFGKSRYHHISILFSEFLKRSPNPREEHIIIDRYGSICRNEYLKCETCEGLFNFLEKTSNSNHWVVSGSDEVELKEVFRKRRLDRYFIGIHGSPIKKSDNIKNILETHQLVKSSTCMVGDSIGDLEAAKDHGLNFIFCKKYSNTPELAETAKNSITQVIETLAGLK